jgi:PhnB protein
MSAKAVHSKTVKPVPAGFHTVTPYLIFKDAAPAMEFYEKAFGATELFRKLDDDGKIRHAEMLIGTSPIMMAGEFGEYPQWKSAESRGGSPVHMYLYVEDCDALFARALAAGATELLPMQDQEYGDRQGGLTDPFGHVWYIATRIRDIAP